MKWSCHQQPRGFCRRRGRTRTRGGASCCSGRARARSQAGPAARSELDARITEANGGKAIPPWVLHDLRRTFVTRLNDLGVEPHVIEALVNHTSGAAKAGVAGVYNRSAYTTQKRAALALWCGHVAKLVDEVPAAGSGDVVPLRRAG